MRNRDGGGDILTREGGEDGELTRESGSHFKVEIAANQLNCRSIGECLVQSEVFRAQRGRFSRAQTHLEIHIDGWDERSARLLGRTHLTSSGLTAIAKQPGVVELGQQPLTIAELCMNSETNGQTIRYIQESAFANAAAAVAEDGAIPEATISIAEVDAQVRKIAVLGKISNEMISDFPAVKSYIDNRLSFMVASKEDSELLNADATGARIKGILNFVGLQTLAVGTDLPHDSIHKAITKVESTPGFYGQRVDAVILNPVDLQNFKLSKDKAGQYMFFGGPAGYNYGNLQPVTPHFWGKPIIETTAIAQGTALVGCFKLGAGLFRRRGLMIEMTNSDQSDFANDLSTVRASTRLALALFRPQAFCTVTGITNP